MYISCPYVTLTYCIRLHVCICNMIVNLYPYSMEYICLCQRNCNEMGNAHDWHYLPLNSISRWKACKGYVSIHVMIWMKWYWVWKMFFFKEILSHSGVVLLMSIILLHITVHSTLGVPYIWYKINTITQYTVNNILIGLLGIFVHRRQ